MQHSAECLSSPTTSPLVIRGLKMLMLLTQSLLIHIKLEKIAGVERLAHTVDTNMERIDRLAPNHSAYTERHRHAKILKRNIETDIHANI